MASRFGSSSLHQRQDPRSALFENYVPAGGMNESKARRSPAPEGYGLGGGYGYGHAGSHGGMNGLDHKQGHDKGGGYRSATVNKRGQYSDAILSSLESQNDDQVSGILGKVALLKSLTIAIGDEIRDSSAMAEKMNEGFEGTRVRLRGTMTRMLVMAEKTGVGWRTWLFFFIVVSVLFAWVWVYR